MMHKALLSSLIVQLLTPLVLSVFFFQTISFVYIVTAVVGVEAWYEPFLFNFLYRDLFTAMIIGKELHVEACFNHHFVIQSQCLNIASDNTLSVFSSK